MRCQREAAVLHAERIEQPFTQKLIVRFARCDLDDATQHIESGKTAVAPEGAGLKVECDRAELRDVGCERVVWPAVAAAPAVALPSPPLISPEPCVSRSRIVISRVADTRSTSGGGPPRPPGPPGPAGAAPPPRVRLGTATFIDLNSGMKRETGSLSRTLPSSTIIITATAVIGFDIEARRNTPSFGIGRLLSMSIKPCASRCAILPWRATSVTAPDRAPGVDVPLHGLVNAREALGGSPTSSGLAVITDPAPCTDRPANAQTNTPHAIPAGRTIRGDLSFQVLPLTRES